MTCSRCGKDITKGQSYVSDPCCSDPGCPIPLSAVSHFNCIPRLNQRFYDEEEIWTKS